jgi:hypothetical protein
VGGEASLGTTVGEQVDADSLVLYNGNWRDYRNRFSVKFMPMSMPMHHAGSESGVEVPRQLRIQRSPEW